MKSLKLKLAVEDHIFGKERLQQFQSPDRRIELHPMVFFRDLVRHGKEVNNDRPVGTIDHFDARRFEILLSIPLQHRVFLQLIAQFREIAIEQPLGDAIYRDRIVAVIEGRRVVVMGLQFRRAHGHGTLPAKRQFRGLAGGVVAVSISVRLAVGITATAARIAAATAPAAHSTQTGNADTHATQSAATTTLPSPVAHLGLFHCRSEALDPRRAGEKIFGIVLAPLRHLLRSPWGIALLPRRAPDTLRGVLAGVKRFILWDYQRGVWQYDVICAVITLFIFLSPRQWFRDQPRIPQASQITSLPGHGESVFWVDPELVTSFAQPQQLDRLSKLLTAR